MFTYANQPVELRNKISELRFNLLTLADETNKVIHRLQCINDEPKWKITAEFVQKVQKFLSSGLPEHEAIENARLEMGLNTDFASWAWSRSKRTKRGFEQYALAYTARKLKSKGFSYQEIAELLDTSKSSILRALQRKLA